MTENLHVWKLWEEAHLPEYGSEWAACFDLKASLKEGDTVKIYDQFNMEVPWTITEDKYVPVNPGQRVLVPTGLVFDLPETVSLRIHPRSGLALKSGIVVTNCEGVVDADYVQQTYVMLSNISSIPFDIFDGDRIAQAEVVPMNRVEMVLAESEPEAKTSRTGGFGSTGI
jgi:dUTP pyrophosphatase